MLTGRITVAAFAPPLPKNNFIIEVTATNNAGGDPMREAIRVHLHTSVTTVALTPGTLTVRPSSATRTAPERTGYWFTVQALFDDDTMGDLTEHHGVTWSSVPADHVDFDGELIIAPGDVAGGAPITITATLPAELGGGSATATLQIGRPWRDDPALPEASIVVGGGWPGTTLPEAAPNVMFLGDGFQDAESTAFEQIATTMVHHLKTDRLLRPFDLLCTSMNFWRAFVPAADRGISFRCEVFIEQTGTTVAWPVPPPERPLASGDFNLGHLIYLVGLPVPTDANKSIADLRSDWDALVGPQPVPHGRIKDDIIESWKLLAPRGFIEELDNFPAMSFGRPPVARSLTGTPLLGLHDLRGGRSALSRLFGSMQSESNVQVGGGRIGVLWAGRPLRRDDTVYVLGDVVTVTTAPALNAARLFACTTPGRSAAAEPAEYGTAADGTTIQDGGAAFRAIRVAFNNNPLLVVVSSFPAGRAVNYGQNNHIAISTRSGTHPIPVQARPMGFVLDLDETDVPTDVDIDTCRTIAHEIGHSFGLGNDISEARPQLSGHGGRPRSRSQPADRNRYPGQWSDRCLAPPVELAPHPQGRGDQRRDHTGRCRRVKIPVVPGQAWQFHKDDTVLLRHRLPGEFLGAAYVVKLAVSPALEIAVAPTAAAANDFLLVQAAAGANVTEPPWRHSSPAASSSCRCRRRRRCAPPLIRSPRSSPRTYGT